MLGRSLLMKASGVVHFESNPPFANVVLLLHGDGANGSTTIIDSSPSPKTVTAVGNAQISTAQSKFSGSSIALDGAGDELTTTIDPINIRTDLYTIETWCFLNSLVNYSLIGVNGNFYIIVAGSNVLVGDGLTNNIVASSSILPTGTWFHIALSFDGATYRLFVDGILRAQSTTLLKSFSLTGIRIGAYSPSYALNGYVSEFRIATNWGYVSDFLPPSAPFPDS
jgi:hypothetical protein